ncbi:MAG: helix-turn-helix domain-containing protein [Candidatus Hodarchaeales archaeon]
MEPRSKIVESPLANLFVVPARKDVTWSNLTDWKVYQLVKKLGPLTRGDLVERTGLPQTTLYDSLTRLTIRGVIVRFTEPRQLRGRCRVFYEGAT